MYLKRTVKHNRVVLVFSLTLTLCVVYCIYYKYFNGVGIHHLNTCIRYSDANNNEKTVSIGELENEEVKVLRWHGDNWKQLYSFCRWTDNYECLRLTAGNMGMDVFIHNRDYTHYSNVTFIGLEMETLVLDYLNSEENVGLLDIGSYIGTFSIVAAHAGYPVIAVEPLVENVLRFCKSVQNGGLSNLVTIFFTAISNDNRQFDIIRMSDDKVEPELVESHRDEQAFFNTDTTPSTVLDNLIAEVQSKFTTTIMKIDVTGNEYEVITGAKRFFKAINVPIIFMRWTYHRFNGYGIHIALFIKAMNYMPFNPLNETPLNLKAYALWPDYVLWRQMST